jgi:hypothetical protein
MADAGFQHSAVFPMTAFRIRRRRDSTRQLERAIERARSRADRSDAPTPVQLLGQVSGGEDWPAVREYWDRRTSLTGGWPQRLGPHELVLNLWPISPGALKLASGVGVKPEKRQPRRLLSTPALLSFDPTQKHTTSTGALAQAIISWVDDAVVTHDEFPDGLALAPPILEEWAPKGQLLCRSILTFDLDWPLPEAEGLTWPPPAP